MTKIHIPFQYDDGGRAAAGYVGFTGDCVTRAIAIAGALPYQEVYDLINAVGKKERSLKYRSRSTARTGVYKRTTRRIFERLGWTWHPIMKIGTGCTIHLLANELPREPRMVLALSKHLVAVVDGVLRDTHDCSREGTRCVYGYWTPPSSVQQVSEQ
jgi:hypothetical protein